ncbi:MAG: FHA domain-containing protein [Candidatus Acidiferrales bacterium]
MPKLELRFENSLLAEYCLEMRPLVIGRGPDCDIFIDNLAVSTHHARVFFENDQYVLQDNQSLNGTFVNNLKVADRVLLRDGDTIAIGKHSLVFYQFAEAQQPAPQIAKVSAPSLNETFVLETKKRVELLMKEPEEAQAVSRRIQLAHLRVIRGKTDQAEYVLTSQLAIIGKSEVATIRLLGWFKPKTAGVITRRNDGYYVGPASARPRISINGAPIMGPRLLHDGDVIEVPGAKMIFTLA